MVVFRFWILISTLFGFALLVTPICKSLSAQAEVTEDEVAWWVILKQNGGWGATYYERTKEGVSA
jgi:hypothetical protein